MRGATLLTIALLLAAAEATAQSDPAALRRIFDAASVDLVATMKDAAARDATNPWGPHFVAAALREARHQSRALTTLGASSAAERSAESEALRASIEAERFRPDRARDAWRSAASKSADAEMRSWCESNARFHDETCSRLADARKRLLAALAVAGALLFGAVVGSRRL